MVRKLGIGHRKHRQRGMTIIELMVVLAVAAAVIAGVIALFGTLKTRENVSATVQHIARLAEATRELYKNQATYAGLSESVLIDAGEAPEELVNGSNLVNVWGGLITLAPTTFSVPDDAARITVQGVPSDACDNLVNAIAPSINQITVNGTVVKAFTSTASPAPATLASACNASNPAAIDFDIR